MKPKNLVDEIARTLAGGTPRRTLIKTLTRFLLGGTVLGLAASLSADDREDNESSCRPKCTREKKCCPGNYCCGEDKACCGRTCCRNANCCNRQSGTCRTSNGC